MLCIAFGAIAQDDYTIKMSMKIEGLPAEYAAFGDQDITTYIKGDKLKTERTGMMMSSTVYYDGQKMTSLTDAMGNKSAFTATKAELEATEKPDKAAKTKIDYTTEKKSIAGYECTKALITTTSEGKESKSTVWCTDKIKYNGSAIGKAQNRGPDLSELKGYPLSMEMTDNSQGQEMKIVMTATEVLKIPLDNSIFVPNTDGYKMMTYKEMLDQQKAMKGRGPR